MKKLISLAVLALAAGILAAPSHASVSVITTDATLANIAAYVGGNRVTIESLSRGTDDPHQVEPRPSMVVKLAHAQVFARIGMDLDMWADGVLDKSGNPVVMKGGKGYVDCSRGVRVQEIPPARLDPSMGDIHVWGNPHYLLDPANGIVAAGNIAAGLIAADPAGAPYYRQRYTEFANQLVSRIAVWRGWLQPYRGTLVTTYHRSWVYFMRRFGLVEFGTMEPRPGMPPSPGHVNQLISSMKGDHVRVMLIEDFRSRRYPDLVAAQTGAKAVYVPLTVGGEPGINDYFTLFDTICGRLRDALK